MTDRTFDDVLAEQDEVDAMRDARRDPRLPGDAAAYVGAGHPATSREMQAKALPRSGSLRRRLCEMVLGRYPDGMTDDEMESWTGRTHQSVSASRNSLMRDGWLEATPHPDHRGVPLTRPTRSGNAATVWRASAALRVLAQHGL